MSDRIRPPRRLVAAYVGPARGLAVYLAGTALDPAAIDRAAVAMAATGWDVVTPTMTAPDASVDEVLGAVADDLDALAEADVLVVLPDSGDLFEITVAAALGIPTVTLGEAIA